VGNKVSLPCKTSQWDKNEVLLILWYRENSSTPFYKLDARNRPLFKAKHNLTDDKLQKRFYFDVTTIPPVLKISPVLIEDEGNYRCRVDYRKTRTQNVFSTLRVIGIVKFEYQNNVIIENQFLHYR
jgi:hypothetical protein